MATGGAYVYGSYPTSTGSSRSRRPSSIRKRREATLHRIQQLVHEKVMYAPIWELAFLNGVGPARRASRASA